MSIGTRRCTALRTRRTVFGTLLSIPCLSDTVFLRCFFQSEVSLYYQKADSSIKFQKKRRLHVVVHLQSEGNRYFCLEVCSSVKSIFLNRNMNLSGESACMKCMFCVSEEFRQSPDERCKIHISCALLPFDFLFLLSVKFIFYFF